MTAIATAMTLSPGDPVEVRRRSRRIFLLTVTAAAALLLGWAATGAPFPGATITAEPDDLVEPTNIVGIWGVAPTSIAVERLDGVALSQDWTGITARYSNPDGSIQIFSYVGNQPFGDPPAHATVDDATGIARYTDSAGTDGAALHWTLPGHRYAGISVWATTLPDDVDEFLLALAAQQHANTITW